MQLIEEIDRETASRTLPDIRPGDTVRMHLMIREGNKERVQVFEGLVIRRRGGAGPRASVTVRRIASGVGVERVFLLHSPRIVRIQITKRSRVRRGYLTYIRGLRGRAARLPERRFDRVDMNMVPDPPVAEADADSADLAQAEDSGIPAEVADSPEEVSEAAPAETPETTALEEAATGEVSDAEVTEVSAEDQSEPEVEISTEEIASTENEAAGDAADDPRPDENEIEARAVEEGVDDAASDSAESPAHKKGLED